MFSLFGRLRPFFLVAVCLIGPFASRSLSNQSVNLGPSDNFAIDQPIVQVALYTQPSSGAPQFLGPDTYNNFLLDTGSSTILSAQAATDEMNSHGLQTVATYNETGVAGSSPAGVSSPYRFDYAGTDGVPLSLSSVRILASNLDLSDLGGVAGMPLMVGRSTLVDLTALPSAGASRVAFSAAPPPGAGHRYDIPLQMVDFPLDGQQQPTDPLPTSAPLSMAPVLLRNGSHMVESHFIVDTGAQVSILSTATAVALGINPATDSIGSVPVGGVGGTVDMPIVAADSIAVHSKQGIDLQWTGLQVGVLDIDPTIAGVLGMDLLSSGWLGAVLGIGGNGYLSDVNFDFRNSANLSGDMLIDVDPGHDVVGSDNFFSWDFVGSGNYGDATKWYSPVVPSGPGANVTFGNGVLNTVNAATVTVTVNGAEVAGSLVFNNTLAGTSYILASDGVAGHGITLDNGGLGATVSVAAGVSGQQQIQAHLTLADNTTFNIATGSSLLISLGGISETGGSRGITLTGGGALSIAAPSTYTGGTTVNNGALTTTAGGTLGAGPLTINAADAINSVVYLGTNQTVSSLSGAVAGTGTARVNIAAGAKLTVSQSTVANFAGNIGLASGATANSGGALAKIGNGALEIDGAPAWGNNSSLQVNGGTMRFNVANSSVLVGSGVIATVSNTGTLELAGSVSALSSGTNRVNIINSSSTGLLVSGTHQQVGNIDGTGTTQVNAGSDLTANHIVQSALVIGGTTSSRGVVTIDASDASGNPLVQPSGFALAGSLRSSGPFGEGDISSASLSTTTTDSTDPAVLAMSESVGNNNPASVPEPSTVVLAIFAILCVVGSQFTRHHFRHQAV